MQSIKLRAALMQQEPCSQKKLRVTGDASTMQSYLFGNNKNNNNSNNNNNNIYIYIEPKPLKYK